MRAGYYPADQSLKNIVVDWSGSFSFSSEGSVYLPQMITSPSYNDLKSDVVNFNANRENAWTGVTGKIK